MFKHIAIVGIVLLFSKLTAFIVEILLAYRLGADSESDALNVLFSLHNLLYPLISIGIWKVFLPQYINLKITKGLFFADAYANKLIFVFIFISVIFSCTLYFGSNFLVSVIVPGFDPIRHDMAVSLIQLSCPQYIFVTIAAIFSVMLQAHKQFFGSQIREIATYIPLLFVLIFCYEKLGINSLAIAILIGAIFRFLVQLPFVRWGYTFRIDFSFDVEQTNYFFKALPLVMLVCSIDQVNQLVTKIYASFLELGTLSVLSYATRLNNAFGTLLGVTIGTVLFPRINEVLANGELELLNKYILNVISAFFFVLFPITVFCQIYAFDLVSLAFYRGAFSFETCQKTSLIFAILSFGMLSSNLFVVLNNIFYAKNDLLTPLKLSGIILSVNLTLCHFTNIYNWGLSGLAMANVISSNIGLLAIVFSLRKSLRNTFRSLLIELSKMTIATLVALLLSNILSNILIQATFLNLPISKIIISSITFASIYLLFLYILRSRTLMIFKEKFLLLLGR